MESVQIQEVPRHRHSRPRVRLRLQAQATQEEALDGLGQAGLRAGSGRRAQKGRGQGGHSAMVSLAGVSTLATRRDLR